MTKIIHVRANTIRNGLSLARRHLGLLRIYSTEMSRERVDIPASDYEPDLRPRIYLSRLSDGTVVVTHLEQPWPRGASILVLSVTEQKATA